MTARGIDRSGLLHGKRARAYRGKHVALVGTKAHPALAMSSVPLVRRTARSAFAAPQPVDLSLDQTADGFSPGNPVVPADFPEQLNDPMTVGSAGIAIRVNPDEPGNPTGSLIAGGDVVFYPDAARDTDVLAQAAAEGLEISAQLRSVDSPEDLHLAIDVPDGYTVRNVGGNTVAIARNGKLVAAVLPPSAVDAQGTVVPTSLRSVGNDVIMHVAHKSGSFAYPILADPTVSADWGSSPSTAWKYGNNLSTMGYWGAAWYKPSIAAGVQTSISAFSSPFSAYTSWISGRPTMPTQIGSGTGLWLWAAPTTLTGKTYNAGDWVESYTTAPGGANSYFQGMQWNYQTLNGGSQNSDANLVLVNGLYSPARNTWVSTNLRANNISTVDYNVTLSTTATDARQAATLLEFFGTDNRTDWATAYQGGVVATVSDTDTPSLSNVTWHVSSNYTNGVDANKPTFDYTATDGGLGVSGVRLYVDGNPVTKYTTNDSTETYGCTGFWDHPCPLNDPKTGNSFPELNSVADGTHTFQLAAVDSLGKVSALSNSATVKLDHTGPNATIGGVTANQKIGDGAFTIDASATDDLSTTSTLAMAVDGKVTSATPDGQVVRACSRTAGTYPACSTIETNRLANSWTLRGEDLAEGSHEISVGAMDSLGNYTQALAKVTVTVHHADTTGVGPGGVNLLTGDFSVSANDASIPAYTASLGMSRTYHSRGYGAVSSGVFGPGWTTNLPTQSESWAYTSLTANSDNSSIWVTTDDGEQLAFTRQGTTQNYTSPDSAPDLTLKLVGSSPSESFTLTDLDGNTTSFSSKKAGANSTSLFYPTASQGPLSSSAVAYTWDTSVTPARPTAEIGPAAPGVSCDATTASNRHAGCKVLLIEYASADSSGLSSTNWGDKAGQISQLSLKVYDDTNNDPTAVPVAKYAYDNTGRLRAEWDPRITPNLKTTYDYDSQGNLTKLTPPGQQPWNASYATISGDSANGRLSTVSRTDTDLGQTPTWTMAYNVPLSGAGAPFQMAGSDVAAWGQSSDAPVYATAVIPPDGTAGSYAKATITYLDQYGREVNTADRAGAITSTRYEAGSDNVVRQLTAANRVRALAAGSNSASVADSLATIRSYSSDHAVMVDEQGPTHTVKLDDGSSVQARTHTRIDYDENAPTGGPYRLPTTTRVSALVGSTDYDTRTTTTGYAATSGASGWTLRQPTTQTVRIDGTTANDLTSTWVYDTATGQVANSRLPGNSSGGDAHDTKTSYYAASSGDPDCQNKAYVGLVCKTGPVAQPSGVGTARPSIPTTYTSAYNTLGEPTTIAETGSVTRTTTIAYDAAGRPTTRSITTPSGMEPVPAHTTVYSDTQGAPVEVNTNGSTPKVTWTLDGWGRTGTYTDATGNVSSTSYDRLGRVASHSDGKGTQTYSYDAATGRATKVSDSAAGDFTANATSGYDPDGNLTAESLPGGLVKTITYDETGDPVDLTYVKNSNTWLSDHVTESAFSQWRSETGTQGDRTYAYDPAGRLTKVTDTPTGQGCKTRVYGYDRDSNRTSQVSYSPASGGACQSSGVTPTSRTYDEADRINGTGYTYDAFGNTLAVPGADANGGQLGVSYYADNRVRTVSQDGLTRTVTMDPVERTLTVAAAGGETTTNHFDGSSDSAAWISETTDGSGWTRNIAGLSGSLEATAASDGGVQLQLSNLHGDIAATAGSGSSSATLLPATDEFGTPTANLGVRYAYLGTKRRALVAPSGVILMGQRLYAPGLGRFLQTDPVAGGSANAYDYVNQDPVNSTDLGGLQPDPEGIRARVRKRLRKGAAIAAAGAAVVSGQVGDKQINAAGERRSDRPTNAQRAGQDEKTNAARKKKNSGKSQMRRGPVRGAMITAIEGGAIAAGAVGSFVGCGILALAGEC